MEWGKETGHFEAAGGRAFESEALALRSQAGWLCHFSAARVSGLCRGKAGTALLWGGGGRGVLEGSAKASGLAAAVKVVSVGRILSEIEWAGICVGLATVIVRRGAAGGWFEEGW